MSSIWGNNIKISIFGESHGTAIGATMDGLPEGQKVDFNYINIQMKRRLPNRDDTTSSRKENDNYEILSGIFNNTTTGAPICAIIKNENANHKDYNEIKNLLRPGHADFTAKARYKNFNDFRGGGHLSGRLTAPLVLFGALCRQILETKGIKIAAHIYSIKDVSDTPFNPTNIPDNLINELSTQLFPVIMPQAQFLMKDEIKKAKLNNDSVGGIVECAIVGLPAGIGNPIFDNIESVLSSIIFSIPSIKGIEFGNGFNSSYMYGSNNNDEFFNDNGNIRTKTNNHGGILGGISSGMPILFKVAVKPTPSIFKEQNTVNLLHLENAKIKISGRHDPCIVSRIIPVIEAASAIAIINLLRGVNVL